MNPIQTWELCLHPYGIPGMWVHGGTGGLGSEDAVRTAILHFFRRRENERLDWQEPKGVGAGYKCDTKLLSGLDLPPPHLAQLLGSALTGVTGARSLLQGWLTTHLPKV